MNFPKAALQACGFSTVVAFVALAGEAAVPATPLDPPVKTETVDLGGGVTMEFVLIPAGSFLMGSLEETAGDADETPRHKVTLTQPFHLGKCEVTQEQWKQLMPS